MEISNHNLVLILKNAGTACNIGCKYCAEERKKYVEPLDSGTITMNDIERLMELTSTVDNITVIFHGGEPLLLPVTYYEEIITKWRKERNDIFFGFQTNATLIDDDWLDFFERHRHIVGISISFDGDEIGNSNRVTKEGESTFHSVTRALSQLARKHLSTGMITTLTKSSLRRELELYSLVSQYTNIRFLKLNPCYDMCSDGSIPEWSILPNDYARFIRTFFDILFENQSLSKIDVEPILSIIKSIEGIENSFCNFSDKKCNHFLSVYPGGKVIGCDSFSQEDGMYPNIYECDTIDPFLKMKPQPLFSQLDTLLEKCSSCSYRVICCGGCLAVRRRYTIYGNNNEVDHYCKEMQETIEYIRQIIESVRKIHEDS